MAKRIGRYTFKTECEPSVVGFGSVASKKEGEGPLKEYFDLVEQDSGYGGGPASPAIATPFDKIPRGFQRI